MIEIAELNIHVDEIHIKVLNTHPKQWGCEVHFLVSGQGEEPEVYPVTDLLPPDGRQLKYIIDTLYQKLREKQFRGNPAKLVLPWP